MPETIAPPTPAPTPSPTPTPAPAPPPTTGSPVPQNPEGSQAFVSEFEEMLTGAATPTKTPPEAKPPEKGQEKPPDKPPGEQKPTTPPVESAGTKSLRARLAEIEQEYSGFKLTAKQEREKLAAKIAEFEKRKYLTPEQEQHWAALEQKHKELEAELSARDFRESDDFKKNYKTKWDLAYKTAAEQVVGLPVKLPDLPDGTPQPERAATVADLGRVLNADNNSYYHIARELFGDAASIVVGHRNLIKGIENEASHAIAMHRDNYEKTQQERLLQRQRETDETINLHRTIDAQLEERHANIFGKHASDEEINQALQKGIDFVDSTLAQNETMSVQERVGRAALIRRMAGSFPRLVLENKRLTAKLEELEDAMAKLQGTDPGSGGEAPPTTPTKTADGGVDALAKEFELPS